MNLPNKLTMLRVILVPVFMVFAALGGAGTGSPALMLAAGIVFAAASFTDFLDGYLARKNHLVTDFGKFMDPLADKMLTTAAFIYMLVDGVCHPVVLAVILFREFAVAGVRMIAAERGTVIAANMWGKVKTVLQMITIILYYLGSFFLPASAAAGLWGGHSGAVLAGGRGDGALRQHLPVAEPGMLFPGKVIFHRFLVAPDARHGYNNVVFTDQISIRRHAAGRKEAILCRSSIP